MARIKTYVTINSVDVTSRVLKWSFMDTYGNEIPDMILEFSRSVLGDVAITNGHSVVVKRGETTGQENNVFTGKVDTINKSGATIAVMAKDELITLVKTDINTSFDKDIDAEAGVGSAIADTLITEYGGLSTNSGATVVSTGAVLLIEKFVCRKTDIWERLRTIADIYDYQIYYNYDDDYVYFEPSGYSSNANNLVVGTNVSNMPTWEFDNTQLVNQIRVEGAESLVDTEETGRIGVATGYTQSTIALVHSPFNMKVWCDSANPPTTLRTGGTIDATGTFDYSVDEQNNQIVWNTAQYTPGASDYVILHYSYPSPIPIIRKNEVSITAYGLSATTKHFSDIRTVEDAMNRANLFLAAYSEPFVRVKLNVPDITNDYRPGQKVNIVDSVQSENRELIINSIKKSFPHKHDEVICGNRDYKMSEYNRFTLDRIKRLEEELSKNDDILIQILDFTRDFKPRRRYMKLELKSIAGDSLIWNHPVFGIWNSYKWGDTAQTSRIYGSENYGIYGTNEYGVQAGSFILGHAAYGILGSSSLGDQTSTTQLRKVIQGNMTYDERCYDGDFFDSDNSTATFSTITQDIAFTAGQIWYSEAIDIGTTLSWITVTLGTTVGTLLIEISSDNKATWQTVTTGVRTAVSSSDGLGTFIRITENAAGVASIDLTKDAYGQVTAPVITALMEE